jgi:hypothetical protein
MKKSCGTINDRGVRPEDCETLADFIRYFADIPHADWCENFFEDEGRCCARGHLGTRNRSGATKPEAILEGQLGVHNCGGIQAMVDINNRLGASYAGQRYGHRYIQEHPKDRVMAFLRDLAKQCPPECGCSRKKK